MESLTRYRNENIPANFQNFQSNQLKNVMTDLHGLPLSTDALDFIYTWPEIRKHFLPAEILAVSIRKNFLPQNKLSRRAICKIFLPQKFPRAR